MYKPDIHDSEIIPADLGYEIFRKDRKDGYGGVMIGVKRQLLYEHVPTSDSCELVAVKVTCKHNSVIVASLYRPTNNDSDYTAQLINAIECLVKRHPNEASGLEVTRIFLTSIGPQMQSQETTTRRKSVILFFKQ